MRTDFDGRNVEPAEVALLVQKSEKGATRKPEERKPAALFRDVDGKLAFIQSVARAERRPFDLIDVVADEHARAPIRLCHARSADREPAQRKISQTL